MTPKQALDFLDQVAAEARLTRREHTTAVQAVNVLRQFLQAVEAPPTPTEPNE